MSSSKFDIVIIGGGMVGACAAYALAANGFRIGLVEAALPREIENAEKAAYGLRVSAISPKSRTILEQLGIWQQLDNARVCYYEQMHIWHQHGEASVTFDAVELARDNLGAIVENRLMQQTLYEACERQSGIEWFMPDSIEALIDNTAEGVELRLGSGRVLSAGLLLAADGRNSPTRILAGLSAQSGSYQQTAIVANVETEHSHRSTAWQRFLGTGPLAFLPLANGQSSIVWSCDNDFASTVIAAEEDEFCQSLAEAFEFRLGYVESSSARMSFPLGWHHCEHWLEGRVLLIGDAAHGVHPLAGQGVNLGFSDVELLASLLVDRTRPITQKQLRRYERQRKSETWVASQSFSGLKWIFGMEQKWITQARDLGMRVVDETPCLRRTMMEKAIHNIT
ncbi:MAG: FAD-dependent oxidoreductase [Gammaproteobacteria bacterium]|nr:FAD-dependent oxidoreductase [Gammaproteobacteria bacterium]